MRATAKILLPVLLCAVATGEGWKPIPAPPGMYISKPAANPGQPHLAEQSPNHGFERPVPELESPTGDAYKKSSEDIIYIGDPVNLYRPPVFEHPRERPEFAILNRPKKPFKYNKPFKGNFFGDYKLKGFGNGYQDQCPLYKVSFRQDLYFQYIQYKVHIPDLKEFTLCMWSKFHNHSYDHPLFSYAVNHQSKAIYMWVSNTERSHYYNMKINGHSIFRLNYPIRLNKWYHTCQSWNSKTGEWQVWVDSQRIGRGFHNLLVGHIIPGGGIAISGQEQNQYGGGFNEVKDGFKTSGGLLGEITMVQLYRIALTAGKAYTDHRHHHSHFTSTTPEPPELPSEAPLPTPEHPFLENGQLKKPLKVFELAESLRIKNAEEEQKQQHFGDFFDGQFGHNYYGPTFGGHNALNVVHYADHKVFKRQGNEVRKVKHLTNPGPVVYVEKIKFKEPTRIHRNKRFSNETVADNPFREEFITVDEDKTEPEDEELRLGRSLERRLPTRGRYPQRIALPDNRKQRRPLKDQQESGSVSIQKKYVHIGDLQTFPRLIGPDFGYIDDGYTFLHYQEKEKEPDDNPLHASGEDIIGPPQPEPAADEVTRIMAICSGCERDPYRKVVVISWRTTPKRLFSGALFLRAGTTCKKF